SNQEEEPGFSPLQGDVDAVRFAPPDSLDQYMRGPALKRTAVSQQDALEESFFLGLRLTRGVSLRDLEAEFGADTVEAAGAAIAELIESGLMAQQGGVVALTSCGRLLSNEVFERFI